MRILILDEELPYPQDSGKRIRVHALLTCLAKRHEISLCCYAEPDHDRVAIEKLRQAGIRVLPVTPVRREQTGALFYGKLLANLFSGLPYVSWNYCSSRMERGLRRLLRTERFDLLHSEMTLMSPLLLGVRHIPTIAVAHNVEAEIWRRYEDNERSALRRRYVGIQRRRVEKLEGAGLGHLTALCAVTERDAAYFRERTAIRKIHVVPNGVDLTYFTPNNASEEAETLVHAGSMDWRPNVDAMVFFLEEIYPRILKSNPAVRLLLIGRNPSASFVQMASRFSGVQVTGSVEDARPFIGRGAVFVVPLRIGGGSRLKILNALAMGKAIVSTSIGAEGLETRDGEHLLVADTPETFAAQTIDLLQNPAHRKRMGIAGRALVEACYGWDAIADQLDAAWRDAVEGFRHTA